ncbi:UNVERIFIED_CONTAM: hypothetical protein Slati_0444700 [Sesamum latifolium]|uniref:Uncharacterized protein n=1 Tax=Sesamum latifolium TaxID=2727402 RepID=A0AAW2Y0E3_9LAMI
MAGRVRSQALTHGRVGARVRGCSAGSVHGRAQMRTALGRLADGWHRTCPMCGNPQQASKAVRIGSAQVRTGLVACAHGRQADDYRQRPRLGGWLCGLRCGARAGHVMRQLRDDNRPSTWEAAVEGGYGQFSP